MAQAVVTQVPDRLSLGADIRPGCVIADIEGIAVADKRATLRHYLSGSNDGSRDGL